MDQERALDKARKLLAQADGAATEQEADAYSAMAAEWIARHGIDEALLAASGAKPDTIERRRIEMTDPYSSGKAELLGWVAVPLRCRTVNHRRGGGGVRACTVLGYTADLQRVELLYTSLLLQASTRLVRVRPPAYSGESVSAYRRSWLHGYNRAVYARLSAAETKAEQDATAAEQHATAAGQPGGAGSSTALVLLDRTAHVERAVEEAFPHLGKARTRTLAGSGVWAGYDAGQRADLGTPRLDRHSRRELGR
ncbi:MAG TPA: DUF2786 domain-containing protein [Pseudonocardiaceae bacterium]|nr:DUF2786 domain-containing protein [Pseudonocardiaceae bacterium]